jgi:hypothetical protein
VFRNAIAGIPAPQALRRTVIGRDSGAGVIPFMQDRSFNMTLRNALTAMSRGVRGPDAEVFRNAIAGIPAPQALRRTADGAIDLSQY